MTAKKRTIGGDLNALLRKRERELMIELRKVRRELAKRKRQPKKINLLSILQSKNAQSGSLLCRETDQRDATPSRSDSSYFQLLYGTFPISDQAVDLLACCHSLLVNSRVRRLRTKANTKEAMAMTATEATT